MSHQRLKVFLKTSATAVGVEAELREGISEQDLVAWKTTWQPMVIDVIQSLMAQGVPKRQWPLELGRQGSAKPRTFGATIILFVGRGKATGAHAA
jgi:hypothetical protein